MATMTNGIKKIAAMSQKTIGKVYKGLEYGGLGTLAALDAHEAYKGYKEKDPSKVKKGLVGAGALGALMGATHLAGKIHK